MAIEVTSMHGTAPLKLDETIPPDGVSVLVLAGMLARQLRVARVRLYTLAGRALRATTFLRPPAAVRFRIVHAARLRAEKHHGQSPFAAYAALFKPRGNGTDDDVDNTDDEQDADADAVADADADADAQYVGIGTGAVVQVHVQSVACERGCRVIGATCRGVFALDHVVMENGAAAAAAAAAAAHQMAAAALRHAARVAPWLSRIELITSAPELTRESIRTNAACSSVLGVAEVVTRHGFIERVPHTCSVTYVAACETEASAVRRTALQRHLKSRMCEFDVVAADVLAPLCHALHALCHAPLSMWWAWL
jgi:hypothetical protein